MSLAIGIDTGGTYTDGVIWDLVNQKTLAKTKSLTTYEDLTIGIRNCINELGLMDFSDIQMVSLSTTLATNAIVEGRGSKVGLILIGEEPIETLPVNHYAVIKGGHDIKGNPKEALDITKAREALAKFKNNVEAIAVSGFLSVRNPEHELQVKELIKQTMDIPVVCGHQLTTSLGFYERSITAALNAKLIPIIANLIKSVKKVLNEKGINPQLMIVKGDGTLMNESTALERPIETILSGPAASIIGATTLTDTSEAIILDMGGTTSDIAVLQNGIPRLNFEGARVGGWLTRVQAANINTFGIGGDSYLRLNKNKDLLLGPQKVWPLSVLGDKYPNLIDELEIQQKNLGKIRPSQAADCYFLVNENISEDLTMLESKVIQVFQSGAHTLFFIAETLNTNPFSLDLDRIVNMGILGRGALTPTDILHVDGTYTKWNSKAAHLGVNILARLMNNSVEQVIEIAKSKIIDDLSLTVLESMINIEEAQKELTEDLKNNYFIKKMLNPKNLELFHIEPKVKVPIIGIGAPVEAYLPQVAKKLNTELIIPQDSDVANAIGAASGNIMHKVEMLIKTSPKGFVMFSQWERKEFPHLNEAKKYALAKAKEQAILAATSAGASHYQIFDECIDKFTKGATGTYIETRIEVTVVGHPKWLKN